VCARFIGLVSSHVATLAVAKVFAELQNVAQSVRVFEFMNVVSVESDKRVPENNRS